MNSREKGKRGERAWRDELRANGYPARRGQQFSGSPDSPDVVCEALDWIHFEVKAVERLDLYAAMEQARRDAGKSGKRESGKAETSEKVPVVAHRRNFWPWLVSMDAERFYRFLKVDLTGDWARRMAGVSPAVACAGLAWLVCEVREGKRLNIHEAIEQARADARKSGEAESGKAETLGKVPIVAHRRPGGRWVVTVTAETFFQFLRGVLPPEGKEQNEQQQKEESKL